MLKIKYLETEDLIPYENNSRAHSVAQIKQIADSIEEFGFTNPILIDEKCSVIAGHGRLLAADLLGLNKVPTIQLDNLTEAQRRAYVIADNKLALNADWNMDNLMAEIKYLQDVDFDTDITGFSVEDLKALIEFDYSDDSYTPDEEEETFNNAIIQYVIIFDDEEQQKRWGVFLNEIKQLYPDLNTHGARISEYLFDKGF